MLNFENVNKTFTVACLLSLLFLVSPASIAFGQTTDELLLADQEPSTFQADTARITTLIDQSNSSESFEEQLRLTKEAYEIAKKGAPPSVFHNTEVYYGWYLAYEDFEEGIALSKQGIQGLEQAGLIKKASQAVYDLAIIYEDYEMLDSAIYYYKKAFESAQNSTDSLMASDAAYSIGYILSSKGDNLKGLEWSLVSKKLLEGSSDSDRMGMILNQIGIIYDSQGIYSDAIKCYLDAMELAKKTGDLKAEMYLQNNIAIIYLNLKDTVKAVEFYETALATAQKHNFKESEATFLNNLSEIKLYNGDTVQSIAMLRKAIRMIEGTMDSCFVSYPLEGLGSIFMARDELDSARYFYHEGLRWGNKCQEGYIKAAIFNQLGTLSCRLAEPDSAVFYHQSALAIAEPGRMPVETQRALEGLHKAYKKQGQTSEALFFLEKLRMYTDSVQKINEIGKALEIAAEFEFKKALKSKETEQKIALAKHEQELKAKSREKRIYLIGFLIALIFMIIMARLTLKIRKTNRSLEKIDLEKTKLMGVVAHDLRNPLKNIEGLLNLIDDTSKNKLDEEIKMYLNHIGLTSDKMSETIDKVLNTTAIENMEKSLKVESVNLADLLAKVKGNFERASSEKNLEFKLELIKGKNYLGLADRQYLEQALDNLVSNAIKFSQPGESVILKLCEKKDSHSISVIDRGPGISQNDIKTLFKEYTTSSNKPTDQESSTGMGLYIVHRFVTAMGGKISMKSEIDQGSTFELIIPKA